MKQLRVIFGLALVPLCAWLGSFVHIGTGNGIVIGFVLGIVLSYLFFAYGPGHRKRQLPTSYYLNNQNQDNGGFNQQAIDIATVKVWENVHDPRH